MLCLIDSIRHGAPAGQRWLRAVEDAHTLTALLLAAWSFARVMTVHSIEDIVAERACRATAWPRCPACGVSLRRKGCVKRQVTSLCGPLRWPRRGGRCPRGCDLGPVAPCDAELGMPPHQRTSGARQSLGGALAVLVPCATVARWRGWESGGSVSPRAVWCGAQAAGQRAMERLQAHVPAVATGDLPP